jgi:hypothetical protein
MWTPIEQPAGPSITFEPNSTSGGGHLKKPEHPVAVQANQPVGTATLLERK